jgi:hypothetical protein
MTRRSGWLARLNLLKHFSHAVQQLEEENRLAIDNESHAPPTDQVALDYLDQQKV